LRAARFTDEQTSAAARDILDRLRSTPGIRTAGASAITPISGAGWNGQVVIDGYVPRDRRDAMTFFNAVTEGFFTTLGTRLVAGRDFDAHDVSGAPEVAVINEAVARKFFRGGNPIGRRIGLPGPDGNTTVTVIGVVRDAKYGSLREKTREVVYLPMAQRRGYSPWLNIEVKGPAAAATLIPAVTKAIAEVNPRVSLSYTTLSAQVDASIARERMLATLSAFFGALALLLAVIGLYGTMSYTLAQRRKEIGVRIALGAARSRVVGLVLGEVGRMLALGVVIGGALAYVATRWVTPFLFGITPVDPTTWLIATATLAAAAIAAGAVPAWRAATSDPMLAIRTD
jgi:predicted permease